MFFQCIFPNQNIFISFTINLIYFFIKFINVSLVNTIIEIWGVQFYNTSSVCYIVWSPPQAKSPFITVCPFTLFCLFLPPFPTGNHHAVVHVHEVSVFFFVLFLIPSLFHPTTIFLELVIFLMEMLSLVGDFYIFILFISPLSEDIKEMTLNKCAVYLKPSEIE